MEQLLLNARNLAKRKPLNIGQIDIGQSLKALECPEIVFIEAALPPQSLILHWQEFARPLNYYKGFEKLLSPKLLSYKFQYFGQFYYNQKAIDNSQHLEAIGERASEFWKSQLGERLIYESSEQASLFNCSWLIDFLLNAQTIAKELNSPERLIWQSSSKGFELVLEKKENNRQITERQVFGFENQFEFVSCKQETYL